MSEQQATSFQEKLKQKRKEMEEREEEKSNFTFTKYDDKVFGFEQNKFKAFRVISESIPFIPFEKKKGNAIGFSIFDGRKNEFDPQLVFQSKVLDDKGKGYCIVNWKSKVEGEEIVLDDDWILKELYDKVNEGKWVDFTEEDVGKTDANGRDIFKNSEGKIVNKKNHSGHFIKFHKNTEVFKRINEENTKEEAKYKENFYPSSLVFMNAIDRMDDWCKENKRTKIICKRIDRKTYNEGKDNESTSTFIQWGIPGSLYKMMIEQVVEYSGSWDIDIAVKKLKDTPYYIVRDSSEDKIPDDVLAKMKKGALTDEEREYERNNIDTLTHTCSYDKMKKRISGLFLLADAELGTNFSERLNRLHEEEKKQRAEARKENKEVEEEYDYEDSEDYDESVEEESSESVREESKEVESSESTPATRSRKRKVESGEEKDVEMSVRDYAKEHFKFWDKLEDIDKEYLIKNSSIVSGNFKWNEPDEKNRFELLECDNSDCFMPDGSRTVLHEDVLVCPVCGLELETE